MLSGNWRPFFSASMCSAMFTHAQGGCKVETGGFWQSHSITLDMFSYTVQCGYNTLNFLTNIHQRHPIAGSLGQSKGCLLWMIFLQLFMQYLTILDCIIMALHCTRAHLMIICDPCSTCEACSLKKNLKCNGMIMFVIEINFWWAYVPYLVKIVLPLFGWWLRPPTIYDETGAAACNIHCYTVIGFW